ncbi:MAG TPA: sigma-54 dependent transcriptional regulator [Candidatus Kapabacteria bacterium]|nr:sigma-54 dependent transcriptional regulator [Candidatus Kapabacteria bacterium]
MAHILIIDDEAGIRDTLAWIFEYEKHSVQTAESGSEGLKILNEGTHVDCIILDVKMPGMDGIETLQRIREIRPDVPVVMISGHGTIETAVEATKLGAFDFVEKPPDREKLLLIIRNATEKKHLETQVRNLSERLSSRDAMLGTSAAMRNIRAIIERVSPTEARVLITGENGSGKELVARAIHKASRRTTMPFIEVNCAAIPRDLIESELFGHEKGSFTGAQAQRIGKFEQADGGILFLDEIGDMSLEAQAKVLKVIDEGWIERVGSSSGKPIKVDVRIIAATNKNLPQEIRGGRFREDLYHRLNVIPIFVPPLRERKEDIPLLVRAFADEFAADTKRKVPKFDEDALHLLMSLPYSGNIRELRNIIERIIILTTSDNVHKDDVERLGIAFSLMANVPSSLQMPKVDASSDDDLSKSVILTPADLARIQAAEVNAFSDENAIHPFEEALAADTFQDFKDRAERLYIEERLREYSWNISRTAEAMNIQRSHLYTKMRKFGLMKDKAGGEEVEIEENESSE